MNIAKYEHACLVVTSYDEAVIIDPGIYSASLPTDRTDVVAIVITHIHSDHIDPVKIQAILAHNPKCLVYTTPEVAATYPNFHVIAARAGDTAVVGTFTLEFFGDKHEVITTTANIGVLINDQLYYPGDSYTLPGKPVVALAAPASAPWLRITEAVKFVQDVNPKIFFPTHNALLSEIGESIQYGWFERAAAQIDAEWRVLKPTESIEI
jgi:L-ascorbate metabolism protein UlaG (beta-lactamase superfamily)